MKADWINRTGFNYAWKTMSVQLPTPPATWTTAGTSWWSNSMWINGDAFLGGKQRLHQHQRRYLRKRSGDHACSTFDRPQVNVPIKNVNVTAQDNLI